MSTPLEQLEADIRTSLRAGDKTRLSTLRMLLTEVKNLAIELGRAVDEDELVALARKAIKRRKDAAEQYRQGGREDRAEQEEAEAVILGDFLPPAIDEQTIRDAISELVAAEGLAGPRSMGPIMKAMKQQFGNQADGATLSRIAREVLAESS